MVQLTKATQHPVQSIIDLIAEIMKTQLVNEIASGKSVNVYPVPNLEKKTMRGVACYVFPDEESMNESFSEGTKQSFFQTVNVRIDLYMPVPSAVSRDRPIMRFARAVKYTMLKNVVTQPHKMPTDSMLVAIRYIGSVFATPETDENMEAVDFAEMSFAVDYVESF